MKICLITKEYFPFSYGGIGSAFYFLGEILSKLGNEVVLLTKKPSNYDENIYNLYYKENFRAECINYREGEFSAHAVLDYSFQLAAHFNRFNESYCADIVLFPEFDGDAFFLVREKNEEKKHKNTAFAVHYSGPLFCLFEAEGKTASLYEQIIFEMERYCIQASSFSIAPSDFIWNKLKNQFDLAHQQNFLLPNPINPSFLLPSPPLPLPDGNEQKNIVFVGRLQKTKGVDYLVKAFQTILEKNKPGPVKLQLIGKDVYWDECQMSFSEYCKIHLPENILSNIDFIGPLSQAEIQDYLKNAWVAVFPSRFEVFGNVALEAIYCGTPVLINKATGLSAVVGSDYDFFWSGESDLDTNDPDSLERQLMKILSDPHLRNELAEKSYKRAKVLYAQFPHSVSTLLKKITSGNNGSQQSAPGIIEKILVLLNQYSTMRLQQKDQEFHSIYEQKDVETKKAWAAYDKKDEEIRKIWEKYDEKDRQLLEVWKKHDEKDKLLENLQLRFDELETKGLMSRQEVELLNKEIQEKEGILENLSRDIETTVNALTSLRETNTELQKVNKDQEKRIHLLWNDLQHQYGESKNQQLTFESLNSSLTERRNEIANLMTDLTQSREELKAVKESGSYRIAQGIQRRKWVYKFIRLLFKQ